MISDIHQEVINISNYLGINLEDNFATEIGKRYTLNKQKQMIKEFDFKRYGVENDMTMYDPMSLLHSNHIYSGNIDQWKTSLNKYQIGIIEDRAYNWFIKRGYTISQNWVIRKASIIKYHFHRFYKS
jgi:hypothetical protein